MEAIIKKYFWVVNLCFIGFGAWLLAGSINGVVAQKFRQVPALSKEKKRGFRSSPMTQKRKNFQVIVDRNYFESAMSLPVEDTLGGPGLDENTATELMEGDGVESSIRASLVGTIVADKKDWSLALITDQTNSETNAYRVGDSLMEEASVVMILTERVVLNNNGVREYIELQEEATPKSRHSRRTRRRKKNADSKLGEGIKKTGDNKWSIARSEIDKTLSNLNSIAMQARIVPSFRNGEANGFKLFAIRPGSLYSKIGIQNGDVIHKINGFSINSPDKALEVYQKLKSARSIDVELTRRGQTKKLAYSIE